MEVESKQGSSMPDGTLKCTKVSMGTGEIINRQLIEIIQKHTATTLKGGWNNGFF
jgi:hypothetical protein